MPIVEEPKRIVENLAGIDRPSRRKLQGARLATESMKNLGQHRVPRRVSVLKPS
jgi:hypothetical protein